MAYQIRYEDSEMIRETKSVRKRVIKWVVCFCAVLFISLVLRLRQVQDFLIPGDPAVTRVAFSSFTQELREGESFRDAAAVFCRQVIESDVLE